MYVYVDTENVHPSTWQLSLDKLTSNDRVYLIYTNKSPKITYNWLQAITECPAKFQSIAATNGSKNALDFILVTFLGGKCATAPKTEHIILSGDNGYKPVCDYYQTQGILVHQCPTLEEALKTRKKR